MPITRLHAGAVFSYPDLVGGDATIVGAAPQWDDDSDATYAISATDASGSASFTAPIAALDILTAPVTATNLLSVAIHLRYSTSYPDGLPVDGRNLTYGIYEPDGFGGYDDVVSPVTGSLGQPYLPDDDGIHEFTWIFWPDGLADDSYNAFIQSELLRVFKSGSWISVATVIPGVPQPFVQSSVTVYEAWVEVEWEGASVVRQWPRDDSYGRNATPRRYPTPRATRRIGGQP